MLFSIIVFALSGVALAAIISLKLFQSRSGVLLFWPDARERSEVFLRRRLDNIDSFAKKCTKRNLCIITHFVLLKIRGIFVYFQHKIDKRLAHLVNLIKGKHDHDLSLRGKVSHFLHDIASIREDTKK